MQNLAGFHFIWPCRRQSLVAAPPLVLDDEQIEEMFIVLALFWFRVSGSNKLAPGGDEPLPYQLVTACILALFKSTPLDSPGTSIA